MSVAHADTSDEAGQARGGGAGFLKRLFRQTMAWKEHEERENEKRPPLQNRQKHADDADDGEDNGKRQTDVDHLRGRKSARYWRGIFWNSVTPSLVSSSLLMPSARINPSISPSLPSSSHPVQMSLSLYGRREIFWMYRAIRVG